MTTDVLIIGGGLAGCAAAIRLAQAGRQVLLVERERAPAHKVCGEFLSGEALTYLQQLGVNLPSLGAVPLGSVRFTNRSGYTEQSLPFAAMSLTRRRLDAEMLRLAEKAGAQVLRGCTVNYLARAGEGWCATLDDGEKLNASHVFVASGKHDLRAHSRPAGKQQGMVAFKMYWQLSHRESAALSEAVELIIYPGGYAGLQPVENGQANLCCLIHASELRRLGGSWPILLAHMRNASSHLQQRLAQAEPLLAKPLTISSLPYGYVRADSDGLWYIGDQAAVIPSFTGDGMSLALHSGLLATDMFLQQQTAEKYQQTFAHQVSRQVALATTVSKALLRFPRTSTLLVSSWPGAMDVVATLTRINSHAIFHSEAPVS